MKLDWVLGFSSVDEMVRELVEEKVLSLAYKGLDGLAEWVNQRMGLDLIPEPGAALLVAEAIETRNCIVHNRGIIGPKYLRTIPNPQFRLGELRELSGEDVYGWSRRTTRSGHGR